MQGDAGPCSLELTVMGVEGKAVYAATVRFILSMALVEYGGLIFKLEPIPGEGKIRWNSREGAATST
jgi:hypothetical protein